MNKMICNLCGKELDFWDVQENFVIASPEIGYGSGHDGCSLELHLCCGCMDSLIDSCRISPVKDLDCQPKKIIYGGDLLD